MTSSNDALMSRYREDVQKKNLDISVVYAGESVEYIKQIQSAATIMEKICAEAEKQLS